MIDTINKNNEMKTSKVTFNMDYPVYYYEKTIYQEDSSSDEESNNKTHHNSEIIQEDKCRKFSNTVNKMMLFLSLIIFSYGIVNIIYEMVEVNFMNFYVNILTFINNLFENRLFIGCSLLSIIFLTLYLYKKIS